LREHFQLNADIIGENDPAADAELIALLIDTLRAFGLTESDFVIRLSSRNAWHEFFLQHKGDPAREYEFYQVIDKLEREDPQRNEEKLGALGFSQKDVDGFIELGSPTTELQSILDNLTARGLAGFVKVDYGVIRGLAYYTGIVFEAFDRKGEFRAIAGGGRYDNLVKLISGGKIDLPALGFGMGDVVLTELLKARGRFPRFDTLLDAFCLIEDEALRADSLKLVQDLRWAGFTVDYVLTPAKPDKQFKRAQELGARQIVRLQRNITGQLNAVIRDPRTREEKIVPASDAAVVLVRV
jgi:histidyl-tRNA synthetase